MADVGATLRNCLATRGWLHLAQAAAPLTALVYLRVFGAESSALGGLVVWLVPLACLWLLAWCLRACLAARDPQAEGARVALHRHFWRLVMAHLASLGVLAAALQAVALLRGVWLDGYVVLTMVLTFVLFPVALLALLTGAQVAARGVWSPLDLWRALAGNRRRAFTFMMLGMLIGGVFAPVMLLILLTLAMRGGAGLIVGAGLSVGLVGAGALTLAAFATVLYGRYAR